MLRKRSTEYLEELKLEQLCSLQANMKALTGALIQRLHQQNEATTANEDASNYEIDCVLFQTNIENVRHKDKYYSYTPYTAEWNY